MATQRVAREEWLEERLRLLAEEKELTRQSDALARQRQELPWVEVDREYAFDTVDGMRTLADLFAGRSQLIVITSCSGPTTRPRAPDARSRRTASTATSST